MILLVIVGLELTAAVADTVAKQCRSTVDKLCQTEFTWLTGCK